jgi:hypothetical protein
MAISMESKIVNTEIMQKIPMAIPSNDRIVRTLFTIIAWKANR